MLAESAATGRTQADRWLELYEGEGGGDVRPIYAASALTKERFANLSHFYSGKHAEAGRRAVFGPELMEFTT